VASRAHIVQAGQYRQLRGEVRGEVVRCGVIAETYDFMTVLASAKLVLLLNQVAPYL
jgi:hypothetical protein